MKKTQPKPPAAPTPPEPPVAPVVAPPPPAARKAKAKVTPGTVACNTVAEVYARLEEMAKAKDGHSSGKPFDFETWYQALCQDPVAMTPAQKAEMARQIKHDGQSYHPNTWPWNL